MVIVEKLIKLQNLSKLDQRREINAPANSQYQVKKRDISPPPPKK